MGWWQMVNTALSPAEVDEVWRRWRSGQAVKVLAREMRRHVSLRDFSQDDLDGIAAELNGRPRQTLGFKTPSEALNEALR